MVSSAGIPVIKISFSHTEFANADELRTWIIMTLKARNGIYFTRKYKRWGPLFPGSIVLFRMGDEIVGEGIVKESPKASSESTEYDGFIKFEASSLRAYRGSLLVSRAEELLGRGIHRFTIPKLTWEQYGILLSEIVKNGFI